MTTDSETDLVARMKSRDPQALAKYLTQRRYALLAFIEKHMGAAVRSKVDPEDILQEVCGEAIRSLPDYDLGDRDPFAWLCQIAQRRIIDAHRHYFGAQKRSAQREISLAMPIGDTSRKALVDMLVASMTTASRAFSRDQKRIQLDTAMQQLPEEQREVLRLRYVQGLPSKEIAARIGKSDGAVRVMLTRALDRFQKLLGPEMAP
jgi:RNA polymerase sigma-70 factor (ECF subfamily)